ncbi:prolyl 4-hydroxylase [Chloropicon primus]|uniref:Prolyl 4-hydroxylase n=1 Tax=Chloropicon primus TaxID=1764295 RepID=A0A5B8MUI4_9CHLO|nr:prolyl 4-hydroxylase [Chloropicon primus]UPR02326.1 prolyl 4-hydroxylase [Chloropicon primus]|eukprot:QDZ23112.1 prolyl 4-hydroxylase [Chloropicon primus]
MDTSPSDASFLPALVPYVFTVIVIAAVLRCLQAASFSKRTRRYALALMCLGVVYLHLFPGTPPIPPDRHYFTKEMEVRYSEPEANATTTTWIETVSWEPRAFVIHNLLTPEECEHIIELGRKDVQPSLTVGGQNQTGYRTSSGSFLMRYGLSRTLAAVVERVSLLLGTPPFNGERVQLLHYEVGQYYLPHTDYFFYEGTEPTNTRVVTALLYLSDVDDGGETNFPLGRPTKEYKERNAEYLSRPTTCHGVQKDLVETAEVGDLSNLQGGKRARVRPKKGNAIVFWDAHPGFVRSDPSSLHEGCSVAQGDKWSATFWICQDLISPYEVLYELANAKDRGFIP